MRLSIFPHVKALPENREEKQREAKKTGVIKDKKTKEIIKEYIPEIVEIETDEDLLRCVTSYCWCPSVFTKTRDEEYFKSADFVALDFDGGITIEEVESRVSEAGYAALCVPSTSHTPEFHKFRLIFPLSRSITKLEVFRATILDLMEAFPEADPSCKDGTRFFFGSRADDGFWLEGDLLDPVIPPEKPKKGSRRDFDSSIRVKVPLDKKDVITELYGEERESIPEVVDYFIDNAHTGIEGNWTNTLNSLVFTLSLQGIDFDTVYDFVEYYAPDPLDSRDIKTIEKAYSDGEEARED